MVRNLRKFILAHSTKRNKLAWFNKARSPRILYSVAGAETPNIYKLIILSEDTQPECEHFENMLHLFEL